MLHTAAYEQLVLTPLRRKLQEKLHRVIVESAFSSISLASHVPSVLALSTTKRHVVLEWSWAPLTLSGPGGGSEARMTKLIADNQKPLTL